jgi:SGNH hydrolase-like domain, acetyltransferase AlgX
MLSPVGRTINLPDDDRLDPGTGRVTVDRLPGRGLAVPGALPHPDTLEVIHHPDDAAPPTGDELAVLLRQFQNERRHRRSVRAGKVLVGGLAASLLAVWLLHPPGREPSGGSENRPPTAFPRVGASGLVGGSSYRQMDAALRDRLALRQYVVKAIGETARDDLGTSLNPDVVMGSTGVPFLSEDFVFPCEHDFEPAKVAAGLSRLSALGRTTGRTITVAIAPDKSAILKPQLGRRGRALMACSDRVRAATEATWGRDRRAPVLTTWKELTAEQRRHPGRVFQRGDSHWTSQGALIWSKALIDRLIRDGEAPPALHGAPKAVESHDEPADNDLYRLMGISRSETVPVWRVNRTGATIRAHSSPSPSGRGIATFRSWSTDQPLITGRTLVVNDSFFSRAEGQLAPYFTHLEVMHWSDFLTAARRGRLPHFDRIIIETVQRGWPERSAWLEPGQPVHEALARELVRPVHGSDRT